MLTINDKKYKRIVKSILRDANFKKTYNIEHHGISRMEHSLKVSYYSYKIARKIGFDYESVARGGLLHDFYLDGDERNGKTKFVDTFIHPKKALNTSKEYFSLNDVEENIIISHMFPIYKSLPKYKESVLVNLVDKVIGLHEMLKEVRCKTVYRFNYAILLLVIFITSK